MDGLTLHQLYCFDAVVSEGGFQAAAAKLQRSHSAVFIAIRNLESQLGLPLLDRDGYRVSLTASGRSFLRPDERRSRKRSRDLREAGILPRRSQTP